MRSFFRKVVTMLLTGIALSSMAVIEQGAAAAPIRAREASWFKHARYGVFFHYLPGGPHWEDEINSFDVDAFARQVQDSGARYVFITLGQNSGYYCSPNHAYESYAGYRPHERCSHRDLPMDLAAALEKRRIRLMLYLPSRAPQRDAQAMAGLSDVNEQQPAPQEFTRKWSEVIREWSVRYGKRVSGWWFDGSYNTAGWDDLSAPYNWKTWAAACRAGNPASILAFNPGTNRPRAFTALCAEQDYTAGEQNEWTATPHEFPAPPGVQWHVLSFLGSGWAHGDGPRLSDSVMIDYVQSVNDQGGVVTMDIHVSPDGHIFPPHLKQLIAIRRALFRR